MKLTTEYSKKLLQQHLMTSLEDYIHDVAPVFIDTFCAQKVAQFALYTLDDDNKPDQFQNYHYIYIHPVKNNYYAQQKPTDFRFTNNLKEITAVIPSASSIPEPLQPAQKIEYFDEIFEQNSELYVDSTIEDYKQDYEPDTAGDYIEFP